MIDLKPFCGDNDVRYYMNAPFSEGEFTYATNGHILVRVARCDDVPEVEVEAAPPKCEKLFADNPFISAVEIPDIPPMIEADCDCCNGYGTHEQKCKTGTAYDCEECNATGKRVTEPGETMWPQITVGDTGFASKYLRLIKALPGIEFSPNGQNPAPFRFDGGDGLLMPIRT